MTALRKINLGDTFAEQWRMAHPTLPQPGREVPILTTRKWRVDLAFATKRSNSTRDFLVVECEGGVWSKGRHTRPSGFVKDIEKYNEIAVRGWRLVRVTADMIKSGEALIVVERALGMRQ